MEVLIWKKLNVQDVTEGQNLKNVFAKKMAENE